MLVTAYGSSKVDEASRLGYIPQAFGFVTGLFEIEKIRLSISMPKVAYIES